MKRPLAVALTGGIAAGKSEALRAFERHGAAVISSDDVVHRLYREDEELRAKLREHWGERVFRGGAVDRSEIGRIVFADRAEIPLLFETGGQDRFDRVVVVTAPPEVRKSRRGVVAEREDRLVSEEEKVRRADFCFVNDGSLEQLDAFVAGVLEELRAGS